MIECPQCGTMNEGGAKNCQDCRINLYWAAHHYAELVQLCQASQLAPRPATAAFLLATSKRVDDGPVATWLRNFIGKTIVNERVERQSMAASEEVKGKAVSDL